MTAQSESGRPFGNGRALKCAGFGVEDAEHKAFYVAHYLSGKMDYANKWAVEMHLAELAATEGAR